MLQSCATVYITSYRSTLAVIHSHLLSFCPNQTGLGVHFKRTFICLLCYCSFSNLQTLLFFSSHRPLKCHTDWSYWCGPATQLVFALHISECPRQPYLFFLVLWLFHPALSSKLSSRSGSGAAAAGGQENTPPSETTRVAAVRSATRGSLSLIN